MGSNLSKTCSIAALSAAVVAGSALLMVPSNAASGTLTYDCAVPVLGQKTFTVVADTNAPATAVVGQAFTPTLSATVSVPEDLRALLTTVEAKTVEGALDAGSAPRSSLSYTVDGTAASAKAVIPVTEVPTTAGAFPVTASGPGAPVTPAAVGTMVIKAGAFTAVLAGKKADSTGTFASPYTITCTPKTIDDKGTPDTADDVPFVQDLTVDTVTVNAAPVGTPTPTPTPTPKPTPKPTPTPTVPAKSDTTTSVSSKYSKKTDKATVKVVVKAASGQATGSVKVTLKRGSKKVKTVSAQLVAGKAKVVFKKISRPGKYKVTAKYPGSTTTNASTGKDSFKVS